MTWFNFLRGKKKRFYDRNKDVKSMDFFYKCGYCGFDFDMWLNEDLKNVNVICPHCKTGLKKEDYHKKKIF